MTIFKFANQLIETNEIKFIIKFKRPGIKGIFIEKYHFKKTGDIIESYENDEKMFETNSIAHMYFIYREVLNFKKSIKNRRNKRIEVKNNE